MLQRMRAKRIGFILAALVALSLPGAAQDRRNRIDVEHYTIQAEVNPRAQTLTATAAIRFKAVDDRITTVAFELNPALTVRRALNGQGVELSVGRTGREGLVTISLSGPLAKGIGDTLTVQYEGRLSGTEESPIYGIQFAAIHDTFGYLMYPSRWFPVNDYTVDRFSSEINVTVPDGYRVLGGGIDTSTASAGKVVYKLDSQRPSFPGSIAIVQGDPQRITAEGVTTALYFRGGDASMARPYAEEMGKVMSQLTATYGLPPQSSLTVVETEDGTPNGYSAPGLLFLSPRGIGKTVNTRLLVNQVARQWWGNSISPASRGEIWIANAFPRYSELMWVEQTQGAAAAKPELKDLYVEALTIQDVPVIQAARLEDYSPEYWAITSAKPTAVLSMLRAVLGDDPFARFLKAAAQQLSGKSVTTDDLRKLAETVGQKDLRGFFIQWFESTGAPEFKLDYTVFRTGKGFRIMGKIAQDLDTFRMPVDLRIETEGNPEEKTVEVVGTSSEFVVESFGRPKRVVIDPDGEVLRYSDNMRVAVAIRRGEMFAEISEYSDALKEYQKALDVNRNSSLAHYRVGEVFFLQRNYQSAANEFRESLNGDGQPKWTEVWGHINLGKIFDITGQRERAANEYNLAVRTKDNTQGAQEEAAKYLKTPYERAANTN
jgi:aminopeptidase N